MQAKIFIWQGITNEGIKTSGELLATDLPTAHSMLTQQNIFPLKIRKKTQLIASKIKAKHLTDFSRQLAVLLTSGIQLLPALQIIKDGSTHRLLQQIISDLQQDLKAGLALNISLQKHKKYFNGLYCSLIKIGEESGKLELIFSYIADHQENNDRLRRKVNKALFYPAAVMLIAMAVTAILLLFVVPQFAMMFNNFGAALPLYTQLIINLANILRQNILFFVISLFGMFIILKWGLNHSRRFNFLISHLQLRLPLLGEISRKAMLNTFCRTLAIALDAGLPIAKTLPLVANTVRNQVFQQAIARLEKKLEAGNSLLAALKTETIFPQRMNQIIAIGEESGTLAKMLARAAEYYEAEVNHAVENLSSLLEPLIMIILGVVVGGLIIGMYLPIFRLGTVI